MNKPTGFVTFLFTDIEGSTKLAQDYPETIQPAIERHHEIMRIAIESNNGFVFEIIGDAFCCAFENAEDAVKAAADAQIIHSSEKWKDAVIKMRIGIHSGNAEWNGKKYTGYMTLARSARIMSCGYGEQIIISNSTYELCRDKFDSKKENISFRDLGERKLKDLNHPVRLFQIIYNGIKSDFPPLKTLDARPNNLPVQLTSFIGKDAEMKQVIGLLKHTHLLTLTGSGGTGKTRFALQLAAELIDDFANGVWLVELDSLTEPALLPQAIIKAFGIKEQPRRTPEDTLCDYLKDKEILIIFDNCEHLIEQCASLTEKLLSNSPKLKIIATSREALRCEGEQIHKILSLETPDPKTKYTPEKLLRFESVRLFIDRASAADEKFRLNKSNVAALAEICFQLDGLPLAIELAAARTKILTVEKIYERLNDRFSLLTGGKRTAMPRQQTLRALIDWSYDLLSEKEKTLWRRLSVFAGGWTLDAAEEICADEYLKKVEILDLLNQLNEKSIVVFERENGRYKMLEMIRKYAEEKLNSNNESEYLSNSHLNFFMRFAENAELNLYGPEFKKYISLLKNENSNLEKAVALTLTQNNKENIFRLAIALGYYWQIQGYFSPGKKHLESILNNYLIEKTSERSKVLNNLGKIERLQGDFIRARETYNESFLISSAIDDKVSLCNSLLGLGIIEYNIGEYQKAIVLIDKSLEIRRALNDNIGITSCLHVMGNIAMDSGDYEKSRMYLEQSLSLSYTNGDSYAVSYALTNLGTLAFNQGDYKRARALFEKSLLEQREIGDRHAIASILSNLGTIAGLEGEIKTAEEFLNESLALENEMGNRKGIASCKMSLGILAFRNNDYENARKLYEESLSKCIEINYQYGIIFTLHNLGDLLSCMGEYQKARDCFEKSLNLSRESGAKREILSGILGLAGIDCRTDKLKNGALLHGWIVTELQSIQGVFESDENNMFMRSMQTLRDKLSDEEFSEYFEEGKKLTLEQVIELAVNS